MYLDLLGGWREAWDLGAGARAAAAAYLAGPAAAAEDEEGPMKISVVNGLAQARDGMARVTVPVPDDGTRWVEIRDSSGHRCRRWPRGPGGGRTGRWPR